MSEYDTLLRWGRPRQKIDLPRERAVDHALSSLSEGDELRKSSQVAGGVIAAKVAEDGPEGNDGWPSPSESEVEATENRLRS